MKQLEELSRYAAIACLAVFEDYTEEEADMLCVSIRDTWTVGRLIKERQDFLDSQEDKE